MSFGSRVRVRLFLDVFNMRNSAPADVIGFATGPTFGMPGNIIAPRLARVEFRFMWSMRNWSMGRSVDGSIGGAGHLRRRRP